MSYVEIGYYILQYTIYNYTCSNRYTPSLQNRMYVDDY